MTFKQATNELQAIGCTIRKQDGEYAVRVKGGYGGAYYTSDLTDAIKTAKRMAEFHRKEGARWVAERGGVRASQWE